MISNPDIEAEIIALIKDPKNWVLQEGWLEDEPDFYDFIETDKLHELMLKIL